VTNSASELRLPYPIGWQSLSLPDIKNRIKPKFRHRHEMQFNHLLPYYFLILLLINQEHIISIHAFFVDVRFLPLSTKPTPRPKQVLCSNNPTPQDRPSTLRKAKQQIKNNNDEEPAMPSQSAQTGVYQIASEKQYDNFIKAHPEKLVVIKFYTTYCQACRMLEPKFLAVKSDPQLQHMPIVWAEFQPPRSTRDLFQTRLRVLT
jgi:thiol-disulfide isomerase/thioredoxin